MKPVSPQHFATVFDQISDDYDRHRAGYPEQLIAQAGAAAGLKKGDSVLEIGCGSGQLTRPLIARGYLVTAVEPGENLLALARKNTKEAGKAEFIPATFEKALLPKASFKAVFSAAAFHWIDPVVSWHKAAELLAPAGTLALIQHFGLKEPRTDADLAMQLAAIKKIAPEMAARWPRYYDLTEIMAGAKLRSRNVSELWSWLGSYDLKNDQAAALFNNVHLWIMPQVFHQTAEQTLNVLRTISAYSRLSSEQRTGLEREFNALQQKLGRPFRSSTATILVTARRAQTK